MKFREIHKTALAKVISDLVQCDGIVNQGEIDFLQQVYALFNITLTSRKKATNLSLSEAVNMLRSLGNQEKIAILRVFQQLSLSDDSLDPSESLLITALLLSIGIELPETQGLNASFVSIPSLSFDTRNAVLYVEPNYNRKVNACIKRDYDAICELLRQSQREFFYLPKAIDDLKSKKKTFRNTLSYIEPTLSDAQLDLIDKHLPKLDSVFLSKEIFLNYLNANGLKISKPSFFLKIGNMKSGIYQDFLILETGDNPLKTLERLVQLNDNILKINPPVGNLKEERLIRKLTLKTEAEQKDISVSALTGSQSDEAYWLGKKMKVIKGPSSRSRVLIGEDTIEYGLRTGSEEEIARLFYRAAARQTAVMIRDRRGEWDEKICRLNRITLPDISVRYMTSRWGSCTPAKGTIRISSRLMHFPPACLDYVLLHEYTHLLVPNHSKKFWDIVEYYMPDYKEHQDVLKHAG